jgi:hypothetical protein
MAYLPFFPSSRRPARIELKVVVCADRPMHVRAQANENQTEGRVDRLKLIGQYTHLVCPSSNNQLK